MKRPVLTIVLNAIAILLLGSLLVSAIGLHRGGQWENFFSGVISWELDDGYYASDDSYTIGGNSFSCEGIRSIDLGWAAGAVILCVGEGDEVVLSETSAKNLAEDDVLRWKVEDGILTIRCGKRKGGILSFGVNNPEKTLTLTIPASLAEKLETVTIVTGSADLTVTQLVAESLLVTSASGDVKLDAVTAARMELTNASGGVYGNALNADRMKLSSASGKKEFTNCTVNGTLEMDSASGDFFFSGSVGELDSDTASGDIELILTSPAHRLEVDSASGDLSVTLPADLPGFTLEMDSASGDLNCDFATAQRGDTVVYGDGSMQMEIDTASGDVNVRKQ